MVQREMDKQAAMENLQILGQLGQQINPELLNRTVTKLLTVAGVLEPGESAMAATPPMGAMPPSAPPMGEAPPQEPTPPVQ